MESPSAAAILELVAALYASAQTYRDRGVVRTTFRKPERTWANETPFTTAYERATNRFRFEFCVPLPMPKLGDDRERRWIIWREGERFDQWSTLRMPIPPAATFSLAIAGATGVSKGAAQHIPALLMPGELPGRKLTDQDDQVTRIQDARVATSECYRIQRALQLPTAVATETLWIDEQSFLIRRIDKFSDKGDIVVETVTSYEPQIDAPLSADALQRGAPAPAPAKPGGAAAADGAQLDSGTRKRG
jgi:hypothetical protein